MFQLKTIRLDLSTVCQLQCVVCPNSAGEFKDGIGYGFMKFADFKKIVDENPSLKRIETSNYGEIFLNPEIDKIIEYAFQKKIKLYALNGTNFNRVNEQTLENLVKFRFRKMMISLDGADQQTYALYRKRGNFATVINNIEKLNHYKKLYHSRYPKLIWSFVLFGHNQHQLNEARVHAKRLNMGFKIRMNWNTDYSPVKQPAKKGWKRHWEKIKENFTHYIQSMICLQLWYFPSINWDGKLLGCCINFWADYGNVRSSSLKDCMRGSKYQKLQTVIENAILSGKKPVHAEIFCNRCRIYKNLGKINRIFFQFIKIIYYFFLSCKYN